MELHNGQPRRTRQAKHPTVVLSAKMKETAYSKVNGRAPKVASTKMEAKLSAMPDTGAMTCIMGRQMLNPLKINKSKLMTVTEQLVGANGDLIALDGAAFLYLTNEGKTTNQIVYMSAQVLNMMLSQTACKGIRLITEEFRTSTA